MDAEHVDAQFRALTGDGLEDEITEQAIDASVERTLGHMASDFALLSAICNELTARNWSDEGAEQAALMLYGRLMDRVEYGVVTTDDDEGEN